MWSVGRPRAGVRAWVSRVVARDIALPVAFGWALVAGLTLDASSDIANSVGAPWRGGSLASLALMIALAAALACAVVATRVHLAVPRRVAGPLVLVALALGLWTAGQSVLVVVRDWPRAAAEVAPYGSDDMFYNAYDALLVLRGQNPYAGQHLSGAIDFFHVRAFTPIARGRFANPLAQPSAAARNAVADEFLADPAHPPVEIAPETTHSYPAGAFLVALPAVWAGMANIAVPQMLALLGLLTAVVWVTPSRWRVLVLVTGLLGVDGVRSVAGGDFEIWPLAFIAAAWISGVVAPRRGWLSGVFAGLACAVKQTAWIALPFYLIWVWRTLGRREAVLRGLWAAGAFVAVNAPWILSAPRQWFASLFLPVSLPLLPDGSGVVAPSLARLIPLAPSGLYAVLELVVLIGALVWYWREAERHPFAGLVLPLVSLFFAWRSSERYFLLLPVALAVALALTLRTREAERTPGSAMTAPTETAGTAG